MSKVLISVLYIVMWLKSFGDIDGFNPRLSLINAFYASCLTFIFYLWVICLTRPTLWRHRVLLSTALGMTYNLGILAGIEILLPDIAFTLKGYIRASFMGVLYGLLFVCLMWGITKIKKATNSRKNRLGPNQPYNCLTIRLMGQEERMKEREAALKGQREDGPFV